MTTLDWKVAGITGATSGPALAGAKLFVAEGAHVYITDRRKARLDAAIADIGGKAIGIAGDASNLRDLDTVEEPLTVVTKESFDAVGGLHQRRARPKRLRRLQKPSCTRARAAPRITPPQRGFR